MRSKYSPFNLPPRLRWMAKPAAVAGAGTSAAAPFLEESWLTAAELFPMAAVPGMAGLVIWFYQHVFKSTHPGRFIEQKQQS